MDRIIVYPGAIPLDTDLLSTNRDTMIALHAMMSATLGTTTALDGLGVVAATPASMQVIVSPGSITQYGVLDADAYGSLTADSSTALIKMGVALTPTTFTLTPPPTAGTSMIYLIEASFSETDVDPVVLPYYNASNPSQPYLGPGNSGASQATLRQQAVMLQLKAGTAATTGTQVAPAPDAGWTALATILVNASDTQVNQSSISAAATTRFATWKLPDLTPGFVNSQSFTSSGAFTVPAQMTRLRVTVIGGGGGGGGSSAANVGGGGGGAAGRGQITLFGMTPGAQIPITVGAGGAGGAPGGNGGNGGSSSFGTYCSAIGGGGGTGGTSAVPGLGGGGGTIIGANVSNVGTQGSDSIPTLARGGDGAGTAGGPGSSNGKNGVAAASWGDGGGGASGAGFSGGAGGGGMILVEW